MSMAVAANNSKAINVCIAATRFDDLAIPLPLPASSQGVRFLTFTQCGDRRRDRPARDVSRQALPAP